MWPWPLTLGPKSRSKVKVTNTKVSSHYLLWLLSFRGICANVKYIRGNNSTRSHLIPKSEMYQSCGIRPWTFWNMYYCDIFYGFEEVVTTTFFVKKGDNSWVRSPCCRNLKAFVLAISYTKYHFNMSRTLDETTFSFPPKWGKDLNIM